MQDEYAVPQLIEVGASEEVILGSTWVGNDIIDQILIADFEFQAD